MNLLELFKGYLLAQKDSASEFTVKNYLADVRAFIRWYEDKNGKQFDPALITKELTQEYQNSKSVSSRSIARHFSSLRKFYSFLNQQGYTSQTPFIEKRPEVKDQWKLNQFKNVLYNKKSADLTIKNYINDIIAFKKWYEESIKKDVGMDTSILLDTDIIEDYKKRLVSILDLSPNTVNRKLSSIRQYREFAQENGIIEPNTEQIVHNLSEEKVQGISLEELGTSKSIPFTKKSPIRRLSKHILSPYRHLEEKVASKIATIILFVKKLRKQAQSSPISHVQNIKREFYAPHTISITHFPWHKKALFHIRHTRPEWYKRYHMYSITHYIHIAILVTYCTCLAISFYHVVLQSQQASEPAFAAMQDPPVTYVLHGKLVDSHNIPITSGSSLRFSIYNSRTASGSALLWQEIQNNIKTDQNGNFSTVLGTVIPIASHLAHTTQSLFVGITVGQGDELIPRERLNATAYAQDASLLQGLPLITQADVGGVNAVLALDSGGKLSIGGNSSPVFQATGGTFTVLGSSLVLGTNVGSNGDVILAPDGSGRIDIQAPITTSSTTSNIIAPDGSYPTAGSIEFDNSLAILATTSARPAVTIEQDGFGPLLTASQAGVTKFTVDYTGAITAGSWQSSVISSQYGGTGANLASASAGTIPYFASSGVMSFVSAGAPGSVLMSNGLGAAPSWNGSSPWVLTSGMISPYNTTSDFGLGGTATASAKFAVLGLSTSSPSVILSNFSNQTGLNLGSDGSIQTQNNNSFTLGGSHTGDIVFLPGNKTGTLNLTGSGRVGIGISTPQFKLDLQDSQDATVAAQIYNTSTSSDADGLTIKLGNTSNTTVSNTNHFISFETAGIGVVGSIRGNGDNTIQYMANGIADFAEYLKKNPQDSIPIGSLLCVDSNGFVTECTQHESTSLIGVASEHPTFVGGHDQGSASIAVGLVGQIKVRVSTENGDIAAGDAISISNAPGVGTKAISAGQIIGRALDSYRNSSPGEIMVIVEPSWYDPAIALSTTGELTLNQNQPVDIYPDNSASPSSLLDPIYSITTSSGQGIRTIGTFSRALVGSLTAGIVRAKTVATDNLIINGKNIQDYIQSIVNDTKRGMASASSISDSEQIHTSVISPLAGRDITINLGDATTSGKFKVTAGNHDVASIDSQGNISSIGNIAANSATISGNLLTNTASISGTLTSQNASIAGTLRADRIVANTIDGLDTQISTLAAMYIRKSSQELGFSHPESMTNTLQKQPLLGPSFSTNVSSLSADFALIQNGLVSLGPASLASASVADTVSIGTNFVLGNNSINTLGSDLEINPLGQGGVSFLAGKIKISTDGTLSVGENANFAKNVTVQGNLATNIISPLADKDLSIQLGDQGNTDQAFIVKSRGQEVARITQSGNFVASGSANLAGDLIASGSALIKKLNIFSHPVYAISDTEVQATGSAGITSIKPYHTEVTVDNTLVTDHSLIYLTPIGDTDGHVITLSRQTPTVSFTVGIEKGISHEIQFNWIIVN